MFTVLMIHVPNAGLRLEEVLIDYYSEHGAQLVSKEQENGLLKTDRIKTERYSETQKNS